MVECYSPVHLFEQCPPQSFAFAIYQRTALNRAAARETLFFAEVLCGLLGIFHWWISIVLELAKRTPLVKKTASLQRPPKEIAHLI